MSTRNNSHWLASSLPGFLRGSQKRDRYYLGLLTCNTESFWRSSVTSYCSWRESSLHVWENELLPLVLTFWELLSSGFWQFYPHTSARQLGWISLKHCQWQMSVLRFGDFAFFTLAYSFFSSKRQNKPRRTWREKPFVSHLTPDGSP